MEELQNLKKMVIVSFIVQNPGYDGWQYEALKQLARCGHETELHCCRQHR